nr:hypothetical protein [Tanacetum cinerariifolium]
MMKNYKLSRSCKVLEAVMKVLVAGVTGGLTWSDYYWHGLNRGTLYWVIIYSGSGMIPILEWSGMNLTEGVDWEAERLNAISKRLSGRLRKRLYMFRTKGRFEASGSFGTNGSSIDIFSISVTDLWEQVIVEMSSLEENQTWFLGQVTSNKAKVKRWMFKDVKAFSHVNFDEYICVALSEGLLIHGKEDSMCVETLRLRRGSLRASPSEPSVLSMYLLKD